ncbi:MAG: hypothetical protein AAB382_05635 [Chloroflexota bacterium]
MRLRYLLVFLLAAACTSAPSAPAQIDPPFSPSGFVGTSPHVYPVETGWFDGKPVQYYSMGTNTPLNPEDPSRVMVGRVWAFVTGTNADGTPITLEGQSNLFDTTVGDPGYSDLWQPFFVAPPPDYAPDTIKSEDALTASGLAVEKQPVFVNCPIVPAGSSLADSDKPLKTAWVRGEQVSYFDFGATSATPGKMYAFVTGFDSDGEPQLVSGQHFVFDSTRTESGYSDFWIVQWVIVDAAYKTDTIRSVADIKHEIRPSTLVVNYPHR